MAIPSPTLVAGIDIGGTNVRCALAQADAPGAILVRRSTRTPLEGGVEPVLDVIVGLMRECLHEAGRGAEEVAAVGCAVPGITDARQGVVIEVANLPGWKDVPLAALLEQRFGVPALVANDVNAAARSASAQRESSCSSIRRSTSARRSFKNASHPGP